MTWDAETKGEVANQLMYGLPMTEPQIRQFKRWLESRAACGGSPPSPEQQATVNSKLQGVQTFEDWCLRYALSRHGHHSRLVDVRMVQKEFWKGAQGNIPHQKYADDFTDDEILEVEQYLRSLAFEGISGSVAPSDFRTYTMWRMALEYGLRIGEILALRVQDLPSRSQNYLKIVRIEERDGPPDPRGSKAPRPKTLSRDLGTYFANSSFPDLFAKYVAEHRWIEVFNKKRGTMRRRTSFSHPYVFIAKSGAPLSRSTAQYVADKISTELGLDFHWHKCRHSFFNRVYAATDHILEPSDRERARQQMKYWGGWLSDESLLIYTNTARRNAARQAAFEFSQPSQKPSWEILS
ncbi:site-specific integrase [Tritonibacter aquimaris]|uniref:site-specific integrase n=1 Tax=Tritonibacter aquimaris TaxID=2663379 RepID=UPI001885E8F6|nr:site-specific integrase [Tritonibacter aquimaris]